LFTRINEYGFLETPYIKVENGKVTNKIEYMAAYQEEEKHIAQANIDLDKNLTIKDDFIFVRYRDDFIQVPKEQVEYIDVSAQQIISVSAALIPFLEHDDANRALMGSNMMRQAVPLLKPEPPIVGTGLEKIVAEDSGMVHKAPFDGKVTKVTSDKIVISRDKSKKKDKINLEDEVEIQLKKFHRTNQDTCINQHPCVSLGMNVKKGQILTDGPGISDGELALGRNLLVAFMPWYGYNYEDAVIISQRIAREDILTSIYIEKHEVLVRVVKNGNEELTSEIPNVPKSSLRNLDKNGIIKVGSYVKPGDVLVGKITPKIVNVDPSPEEKLMRALFGERAGDFTDSSLKASPGMEGVVVDVKLFSRCQEDFGSPAERKQKEKRLKKDFENRNKKIDSFLASELEKYLYGQVADSIIDNRTNEYYIKHGEKITKKLLRDKVKFNRLNLDVDLVKDAKINQLIYNNVIQEVKKAREINNNHYKKERDRLHHGDELPQGVRKMVKVFIAKKRKVEVGDKLSGRHGNKGVISKIVPIEDMPFLEDGTPIDIILNPLGVPSRMNIGQILETHLGWAAKELNMKVETPPFDGAKISDITKEMLNANLPIDGKVTLYDGKTGEPFGEKITIGYIYMMKLYHLVADKMHARSTGPYSLVSQQPLGGKAQHGGQRLGEMEVWALEAYGASRLLQEMLTVKSDDVEGRNKTYEAITKGENPPEPGTPESFNVLINELQSLCLDITMLTEEE
ncbi:MAG: DNA-directed RNA polymerase subunit beta, partial [Candidatus Cloacimonadota bacterium]